MNYSADPSFLTKMFPPPPKSRGRDCTFVFFGKDDRILGHMRKESKKNQVKCIEDCVHCARKLKYA